MSDDMARRPQTRITVVNRRQNSGSTRGARAKAVSAQAAPMAVVTRTRGAKSTALAAAIEAPIANTTVWTMGTGIPMAAAMTRSWVVARIQMPYLPYLRKAHRAPMIAADK